MQAYLSLLAGIVCAGIGGELFVRGSVGIARWLRISPGIVAVTIAAFATSSPELSVSVSAALAGAPQIGMGDALGSNVVNVSLILASALIISGIRCPRDSVRRDFPVALAVPLLTTVLVADGVVTRLEGVLMFIVFVGWLGAAVTEAASQRRRTAPDGARVWYAHAIFASVAGLALLTMAGSLIVAGARGIALSYGLDEFVIGATVVAVGTSVPELATTVVAKLRGHDDVGLGTILGSNLFNGLFIIPIAAMIHPIRVHPREVFVALTFGAIAVALTLPRRDGYIGRLRGVLLLLLYSAYLAAVLRYIAF
jgi:cation:H+ antiporter